MQRSLGVLPLRIPLTVLRPDSAPFLRQASLTSAINRGIRKTRGGVDSFERRTARPSRESEGYLEGPPPWQARNDNTEGAGRPERGFSETTWNKERSQGRYGSTQRSSGSQPWSDNVRRDNRSQGFHADRRHNVRDGSEFMHTQRSSPFDRDNFKKPYDGDRQSSNRDPAADGPNRRERRAAIFGTNPLSESSPRERRDNQTKDSPRQRYSRESPEQSATENGTYARHDSGAGQRWHPSSGSKPYSWKTDRDAFSPTRKRQDSTRDYEDSGRRPKESDDHREEGKSFVRKGTVQPYVKVPLSIPYTTAGSEFLYGTHVVKAALQSGRRKLHKLYIYQGVNSEGEELEQDNSIYKLALAAGIAISKVRGEWERLLNKMSDQRPHNGYVLEASPLPKLAVTALEKVESPAETFNIQIGHQSAEELAINSTFDIRGSLAILPSIGGTQRYPFIAMLDRIKDPGNLGSIIRSAYFLGVDAIVMIEHGTAPIGPVALKSSASAAEYLPLLMVKNEHAFMRTSQENGWRFFAAASPNSSSAGLAGSKPIPLNDTTTAVRKGPCVLLLGSENEGIRPQLQRIVNHNVGVESGRGSAKGLDSLNVGVAAALLMQEFLHGSKRATLASEEPSEKDVLQQDPEKVFSF